MAQVLYLDCFSGAAGDMLLAALLDAGLPATALEEALGSLGVEHELRVSRVLRAGLSATHFSVVERSSSAQRHHVPSTDPGAAQDHQSTSGAGHRHYHGDDHATLDDIAAAIRRSSLGPAARDRAIALFHRLAEAEAAIHDVPIDRVHLHEVGAVDSIIDIVGAVFAFDWFGIDDVVASPLNVGSGTIRIAHGVFPVPAPATMRLLKDVPIYSSGIEAELVTPTGALLVSGYARAFGAMPSMTPDRIGYGAGTLDLGPSPNVLRVVIGERTARRPETPAASADVIKIECEIDDMSPQLFGPVLDRLLAVGALDAFLAPIQMKKGRPGTLLTVLSPPDRQTALVDVLFRETTTIGVRFTPVTRETLDREWVEVEITGGRVRIKVAGRHGETLNAAPEFDDCLRVAEATGRPLKLVQAEAMRAWAERGATRFR
ncbi:MAG TPA: nickel pincer cofactor biosynthesis protein LarC [Vicinamibacterales bacterium]|nr:nickel pincer cofactor biosynthesis protein LarC [Vicinamibacterales bacterium]